MKNNLIKTINIFVAAVTLSACTQYTPSMMNKSQVQLSNATMMEQVLLKDINDSVLSALADHYLKNGTSMLDLTMTYNPTSKSFTAMKAVHKLKDIKEVLKKKGVTNITSQTMAIPNGVASLMVSYDMVQALAPNDCALMPGLSKEDTTRFLEDYKFGCSTETMIAKQIAHPLDLQGNGTLGPREARREAVILDGYSRGEPREPLDGVERDDLASE